MASAIWSLAIRPCAGGVVVGVVATAAMPVSVKKTLLLREPLPCSPAAETAFQPLIRCPRKPVFPGVFFFGGVFVCSQTPVSAVVAMEGAATVEQ